MAVVETFKGQKRTEEMRKKNGGTDVDKEKRGAMEVAVRMEL